MRQLRAISRREIGAFFHSPMSPVILTGFLIMVGLLFTVTLVKYSDLSLLALKSPRGGTYVNLAEGLVRPLVSTMVLLVVLLIPAVTMRLFSPEFRSGRYDLIISWPVPDHTWVFGKWLSAAVTSAVMLLTASLYFWVVWFFQSPELGPVLTSTLGLLIMAGALGAWGTLASVLYSHQMLAYFQALLLIIGFFMVGLLERALPGVFGAIARELSFLSHFERFTWGVLDSRDLVFFVLVTAVPLFIATAVLAGRRLPAGKRPAIWTPPLLAVAASVVIYLLALNLPVTWDLTTNKRYSLAPQTVQILEALADDLDRLEGVDEVTVYGFYQRIDPAYDATEVLLKACAQHSSRFRYRMLDPEVELEQVYKYGVTVSRTIIVEAGDRYSLLLQPGESALINAVYRQVSGTRPVVCHLLGHGEHLLDSGERPGYSNYAAVLSSQGYDLRPLYMSEMGTVPAACDVLIIAGPRVDPDPSEIVAIDAFLARGGAVLALFDPPTAEAWATWLNTYHLKLTGDVIISADGAGNQFGTGPRTAVITDGYGDHEIARSLKGISTLFPMAQPVGLMGGEPEGHLKGAILITSSGYSWAESDPNTRFTGTPGYDDGEDAPGPLPLAILLEIQPDPEASPGRMVVMGNSEFLSNANLGLGGNRDLLLNTVGWLAREESLIGLRGKDRLNQPIVLTDTARQVVWLAAPLVWPLFVGSLALVVMLRHRRRSGKSHA